MTFPFAAVVMLMLLLCDSETVFISLFSSLFHEGGHLFFMLLFGQMPSLVCFGAFGIRIERADRKLISAKKEAFVALGGIMGNCLLFICGFAFWFLYNSIWAAKLMAVNFFIAAFNMLPVRLLDFGRCLEIMLSDSFDVNTAEKILTWISVFVSVIIFIGCVLYNIFIGVNVSLIAVSIYVITLANLKE